MKRRHWNYRVMEFTDPVLGERWQAIHEVHYSEDGKPTLYSEKAAGVHSGGEVNGEKGSLAWVLDRMREALDKPVLRESDFPPT